MPASHLRIVGRPQQAGAEDRPESGGSQLSRPTTLQRYVDGRFVLYEDAIAEEADLRLQVEGVMDTTLSRTPGDDLNLVAGYLFCRSLIRSPKDMVSVGFNYQGRTRVSVGLTTTGGMRRLYPSPCQVHVKAARLFEFKEAFERRQNLYKTTSSTHAAALFTAEGDMVSFGEDVGRHNAFDKAIGRALLEGTLDTVAIAMLSSRLALELAIKAQAANIPILCGFSAATSSGVSYGERNNLTLVGRLRKNSFSVYSNGWRIQA